MIGLGTLINAAAIIAGGIMGKLFGRFLKERHQDTILKANGISVIFIGAAGAFSGMLQYANGTLSTAHSMMIVISMAIGALLGEIINLEDKFERFGEWLKKKTGNAKDKNFVNAFVTASLTVCIGAMAIVGSLQDGLTGDYTTLAIKAILDFIIILVMSCSLGKGCGFSAIPVLIFEGTITLLANVIKPIITDLMLFNLSLVGSILIFCVGINLVFGKKIRVANLLPAVIIAAALAFLPFNL